MSWKGFKKAVERLPQRVMSKAGYSDETIDEEMYVMETRFNELESLAERLYNDSRKYRDAVSGLLNHQCGVGELLNDIYKLNATIVEPTEYVSGSKGSLNSQKSRAETSAESLQAIDQFATAMVHVRDALLSELDAIDRRVLQPTSDFISLMKGVKRALVKREHKRLDFDRHRDTVNKLKANQDRDLSDEKKMFRVEQLLDVASKDYHSINNLLKSQLPVFLQLRIQFVDPCFLSLYSFQLKIFNIMLNGIQQQTSSSYFDIQADTVLRYKERHAPLAGQLESLELLKRRKPTTEPSVGGNSDPSLTAQAEEHADEPPPVYTNSTMTAQSQSHWSGVPTASTSSVAANPSASSSVAKTSFQGGFALPIPASRPPPPKPSGATKPAIQYVRALYDYEAQAATDLSFKKDDKIEVIRRTSDVNDWWTGRLRGKVGEFPGNYVADL